MIICLFISLFLCICREQGQEYPMNEILISIDSPMIRPSRSILRFCLRHIAEIQIKKKEEERILMVDYYY